jgi:hypothetical protein
LVNFLIIGISLGGPRISLGAVLNNVCFENFKINEI